MESQVLAIWNQAAARIEYVNSGTPLPVSIISPSLLRTGYTTNQVYTISVGTTGNTLSPITLGVAENTTPVVVTLVSSGLPSNGFIGHLFLTASANCRVRLRFLVSGSPVYFTGWIPLVEGSGFVLSPSPVLLPIPSGTSSIQMELATYKNIASSSEAVNVYLGGSLVVVA